MRIGIVTKILLSFFISFLIVIVILMNYLSMRFKDVFVEQAKSEAQNIMVEGKVNFDELVNGFQKGCDYIGMNDFMVRTLNTTDYNKIENINNVATFNNNFQDIFDLTIGDRTEEYFINFFVDESFPITKNLVEADAGAFINMKYGIYNGISMENTDWFETAKEKKGLIHVFEIENRPDYVFFAKYIKNQYKQNSQDNEYLGVCVLGIDMYSLMKKFEMRSGAMSAGIAVLDKENKVIFKNKLVLDENVLEKALNNIPVIVEKNEEIKIDDYTVYVVRTGVGISFLSLIPINELYLKTEEVQYIIIISSIFAIFSIMIISIILSIYLTKPIKKLSMLMKSVKKQDITELTVSYPFNDEVGDLYSNFNMLIKRVKTLVRELELEIQRSTKLELQMYQLQINPHFLYNALDSIFWLSTINGQEKISNMTKWLSDIFRYSLKDCATYALLTEEIEIVRSYVMLQQERYGEEFELEVDFEKGTENIYVPKCIIQPIVENAIIHGLPEEDNHVFKIKIYTEITGDMANVCIADNGVGCEIDMLNRFVDENEKDLPPDKIGIRNVNKRLKLVYGNDCGLSYKLNEFGGITAILSIKNQRKMEEFLNESISEKIE